MPKKNPMICPLCGVAMNHHADKIDYNVEAHDSALVDPDLGGVIEEAHTCPECGQTFVRAERAEA
jgi:ribosomal protein S27AE